MLFGIWHKYMNTLNITDKPFRNPSLPDVRRTEQTQLYIRKWYSWCISYKHDSKVIVLREHNAVFLLVAGMSEGLASLCVSVARKRTRQNNHTTPLDKGCHKSCLSWTRWHRPGGGMTRTPVNNCNVSDVCVACARVYSTHNSVETNAFCAWRTTAVFLLFSPTVHYECKVL